MPRFNCARDAAIWDDCAPEPIVEPAAPPFPTQGDAPRVSTSRDRAILAALNQIQMLSETLAETSLDGMQQELVQFLLDAGMVLRREVLGADAAMPVEPEEFELDDMAAPLETRLGAQDYLDFECGDEIYVERSQRNAGAPADEGLPPRNPPPDLSLDEDLIVEDIAMDDLAAAPDVSAAPRPFENLHLLIADANAAHQSAARFLLEEMGAKCSLANVGDAAELARMGAWDAILIDVQMPGRAGLSAIRAMRADEYNAHKRRIPILAFLSPASPEQVRECLKAGADGYLPKPLTKKAAMEQLEVLSFERSLERRSA